MKTINYTRKAIKVLAKLPKNTAELIRSKVREYAADPASLANNVTALKGRTDGAVRLRVADWRVIMRNGEVLDVLDVGPRGSVYE